MELNLTNLLWFFALILVAGGNGLGGLFGGGRPVGPPPATQADVNAAINNQTLQGQLNTLGIATANNNYETARLIQQQSYEMQNQNNANLINAIQGFNNVNLQLQNQTNILAQKIDQLGFNMEQCCCKLQTQALQYRLDDKTEEVNSLKSKLDNEEQTAKILGSLGRFVLWAGNGSPAVTTAAVAGA